MPEPHTVEALIYLANGAILTYAVTRPYVRAVTIPVLTPVGLGTERYACVIIRTGQGPDRVLYV